ncbi:MAG: amylo-alpha-1,6-glucosidase, partial [Nocardioidaceae bacterium]|nr:amylo-alpha-1,6-glucosidase [Nocardioidaceae bacterium]
LVLTLHGADLELVNSSTADADRQHFLYVARGLGDEMPDPTVFVDRRRVLSADHLVETVVVSSIASAPVDVGLDLDLASDLAPMGKVKQGHHLPAVPAQASTPGLSWSDSRASVRAVADPPPGTVDADRGRLGWETRLNTGERLVVTCTMTPESVEPQFAPGGCAPWGADVRVVGDDPRLGRVAAQGLRDLAGLLLRDTVEAGNGEGGDQFLAAGSPWFLTLFGRDSLWAARMLTPFTHVLTMSTLRTLARRQGRHDDLGTEEQPGKILHEVRKGEVALSVSSLPPVYYGSVDATPLFVTTLADAWQWGAPQDEVADLIPAARRCLTWLTVQSEESGWLRYIDHNGQGLSNQGWKDSHDSVQFADGRLADPPIALSEVQAYAYEAAVRGGELLASFGEPEVEGLAAWAASLKKRFVADFWVNDGSGTGGYPAVALDGSGARVDGVASNMGHLLGTGILDDSEVGLVAARLRSDDMSSGFGLRTLTTGSPRFSRLSYHGGSVWPHDTAIAVLGLAREGRIEQAAALTAGILLAAEGFGYRLPELYGGDGADDVAFPSAYPAACRPQAWAAAAPLACLVALTGIDVDAAAGRISHPAKVSTLLGAFRIDGLRLGAVSFSVSVDSDGMVAVEVPDGEGLEVVCSGSTCSVGHGPEEVQRRDVPGST